MHGRVAGDFGRRGHIGGVVGTEILSVEDNDRPHVAVARQRQIPFDCPGLDVDVQAEDEQHDVHIRGNHLLVGLASGRLAGKPSPPRQNFADDRPATRRVGADGDPVADSRQLVAAGRAVFDAAGGLGQQLARLREDAIDVVMLQGHPAGHEPGAVKWNKFRGEIVPPTQPLKCNRQPHHPPGRRQ
jgi:hypothetical protein